MDLIDIPEEHALVTLSSTEIRALWKAFNRVRDAMDGESFLQIFEMTAHGANGLAHKLGEALDFARRNIRND